MTSTSTRALVAVSIVLVAFACTTFGEDFGDGGTTSSGTSGGTSGTTGTSGSSGDPDAALEEDAAPPTLGAVIPCGGTTCTGGKKCCVEDNKSPMCTDRKCSGIEVNCAKSIDCASGTVCCARRDPRSDTVVSCVLPVVCKLQYHSLACAASAECSGKKCEPVAGAGGVMACAL